MLHFVTMIFYSLGVQMLVEQSRPRNTLRFLETRTKLRLKKVLFYLLDDKSWESH